MQETSAVRSIALNYLERKRDGLPLSPAKIEFNPLNSEDMKDQTQDMNDQTQETSNQDVSHLVEQVESICLMIKGSKEGAKKGIELLFEFKVETSSFLSFSLSNF